MNEVLFISLSVIAIWFTMQEGEILGRLGGWMELKLPGWMHNPLFDCAVCMVPYYGSVICWLMGYHWYLIFPAMGLNVVITRIWDGNTSDGATVEGE